MANGNLVLAGVSFPCGADDIGGVARSHGFQPIYLEHPRFASSTEQLHQHIEFCDRIPEQLIKNDGFMLPLLESWVSEGAKLATQDALQFDVCAANVSRSKCRLSAVLEDAGLDFVPRRMVCDSQSSMQVANEMGYPVVLRTDTGYSGRGVWVVKNPREMQSRWELSQLIFKGEYFLEMSRVLGRDALIQVVEPYFEGDEWSVDFIVSQEAILLIRVTEKHTVLIDGSPLCVGYRLIDCFDTFAELTQVVSRWARALFKSRYIYFGCFDVRRNRAGKLIPLDFGARLGSDQIPRLVRVASEGRNPYAAALDAALSRKPSMIQKLREGTSLIHVFAKPNSVFSGLKLPNSYQLISSRTPGYITDGTGRNRIASVLAQFKSSSEFFDACNETDRWIRTKTI
jgi:hypothetical protein